MTKPAFDPWVGARYQEGLYGVRLLVLGEAQYSGDRDVTEPLRPQQSEANQTQLIVRELAIERPAHHRPFWTKVTRLLLNRPNGEPITRSDRLDLWDHVAFYNYIQWWMPGGRTRPTPAMWQEARESFFSVLTEHLPQLILVLGRRLRQNLPSAIGTQLVCIPHPSSRGFEYRPWCDEIRHALASVTRE